MERFLGFWKTIQHCKDHFSSSSNIINKARYARFLLVVIEMIKQVLIFGCSILEMPDEVLLISPVEYFLIALSDA